jgi:hypothetical protein
MSFKDKRELSLFLIVHTLLLFINLAVDEIVSSHHYV